MTSVLNKLKEVLFNNTPANKSISPRPYDFNASNPLGGNGERVDITYDHQIEFEKLDVYQKSHYRRYEFAKKIIQPGSLCGDFACGTGYGSIMLSEIAAQVIGADINVEVINAIQKRYDTIKNVKFICKDLLQLGYKSLFDAVVSFETIEHFNETYILQLLDIYYRAIKASGKLIFSTPYMQEASEDAIHLGFHQTFYIDEKKIISWLNQTGFIVESFSYQNYQSHTLQSNLTSKDFIICVARKEA